MECVLPVVGNEGKTDVAKGKRMLDGKYKKILNAIPEGVFVFDDKLQVQFTNAAFRRFFSTSAKKNHSMAAHIGCGETKGCGEGSACAYCRFHTAMQAAVQQRTEQTETMHTEVNRNGRRDKLSVRVRVIPIEKKLFLGLTDGRYQTEIERELLTAQQLQRRLLPAGKSVGGVPYAYLYVPCSGVGGDLPDVYELDGQTYGVLSDVSGHGISAGMLSTFVKAGLDRKERDLGVVLTRLSGKFNELNQDERAYVTMAAVRIDRGAGVLHYAVAGHNAPILLKNSYGINEIEMPAPPISNWITDYVYEEKAMPFEKGDILALVTDGVTECTNSVGEQFGIERVESVLMQSRTAEDFIAKLKSALKVYCGGKFTDDVTAVAFDL